jgi:FKBP-type peptidyl-prolyl cis-trans isomerase FkpA
MRRSLLALFALAACVAPKDVPIEDTRFAAALNVDLAQSTRLANGNDAGIYLRDLTVGTGDAAGRGQTATMRYTGWLADGSEFDSNQAAGFSFVLGKGEVIAGWEMGVPGMQVGGTRQLIIPPALGYGAAGTGPIPGNAVMVFNVTLVSARDADAGR